MICPGCDAVVTIGINKDPDAVDWYGEPLEVGDEYIVNLDGTDHWCSDSFPRDDGITVEAHFFWGNEGIAPAPKDGKAGGDSCRHEDPEVQYDPISHIRVVRCPRCGMFYAEREADEVNE